MPTENHPWLGLWKATEKDCRDAEDAWREAVLVHGLESHDERHARLDMRRKQDLSRQYLKGLMRDLRGAALRLRSAPPAEIAPWRTKPTHKMKVLLQANALPPPAPASDPSTDTA